GAWQRVRGSDRPLAQDEAGFRRLHEERLPLYEEVAHARAHDADDVVLAAGGIHVGSWELPQGGALVVDASVLELYGDRLQLASTHTVPPGEEAKSAAVAERLWSALRLDRVAT